MGYLCVLMPFLYAMIDSSFRLMRNVKNKDKKRQTAKHNLPTKRKGEKEK